MKLTRRFFLQSTGALAVYCGISPLEAMLGQSTSTALAASGTPTVKHGKTLVVIFLRGGIDGLNFVVPWKDPNYAKLRKQLRIPSPTEENGCLDLDGFFGLNPRARALLPWADAGHLAAAHAVGYDKNTRSHFEEQDTWETGVIGNTVGSDGWLNRHLVTSEGRGPVRAVALGDTLPRILRGDATAYAVRGLDDLGMPPTRGNSAHVASALEHAYQCDPGESADGARDLVTETGNATLEGIRTIQGVLKNEDESTVAYPKENRVAERLSEAARLIKARVGVEVISIDYGGWDTHRNQGEGIEGNYGDKVQELSEGLDAFAKDLGDKLEDTLVLTLSDFGRTAKENGNDGTDHGWANAMLALGGPVAHTGELVDGKRRKVVTDWPGLAEDQLNDGRDLANTTDFRDVLAEVVKVHLGNPHLQTVLPNHTFKPVGLVA